MKIAPAGELRFSCVGSNVVYYFAKVARANISLSNSQSLKYVKLNALYYYVQCNPSFTNIDFCAFVKCTFVDFKQKHKYKGHLSDQLGSDSVFLKMGEYGLISFSDYIFLLTVLSSML